MASFIMAMNINPNAKKEYPDLSHQINKSFDCFADNEIKLIKLYATLGRYDYLAEFEAPDQTIAFKIATDINNLGLLETETWPVIPYQEYSQLFGS